MRLVLARAEVLTAAWDDAWTHLADVRRSWPADPAVGAEVAVIEAQVALGDGRPGSRAQRRVPRGCQAAGIARDAGRPDLACEALETLGSCARLHDLDAAAAAFVRALAVAAAAEPAGAPPPDPQRARDRGDAARRAWRTPGTGSL